MKSFQKKYGLAGWPVKHSLSPLMHNSVFSVFGIKGEYNLFPVKPDEFSNFMKNLESRNISGLNITVPYKERVLPFLDSCSQDVQAIAAANTVVVEAGKTKGFNTDFFGFSKHLQELIEPCGARVALLGAGGAAKAVSYSLIKEGAKQLAVFDIDYNKAEKLIQMAKKWATRFGSAIKVTKAESVEGLSIADKNLLINATPVGLKKNDPLIVNKQMLHKKLAVYDLIYNPALTKLLAAAKEKGLRFSNGFGMLVYQGAQSFLHFTKAGLKLEEVISVMKRALEQRSS